VRIEISLDRRTNRPNGDGHVYFSTRDEISEALKCDRKYMGTEKAVLFERIMKKSFDVF
jgi:RNA recognition motif-containing protein